VTTGGAPAVRIAASPPAPTISETIFSLTEPDLSGYIATNVIGTLDDSLAYDA
jgi:hypothetical protein